jgi:hypothetical protein
MERQRGFVVRRIRPWLWALTPTRSSQPICASAASCDVFQLGTSQTNVPSAHEDREGEGFRAY